MDVYVVVSGEFTDCVEESSVMVRGVFKEKDDAIKELRKLRDQSLEEFKNEYLKCDYDNQVIIGMKDDDDYEYRIEIYKWDVK